MWNWVDKDLGLLVTRLGIGALFIAFGFPKISAGTEMWEKLGSAMENIGITFAPAFWGFCAAFAEFGGGILLVLGFLFRPALALMIFTMFMAILVHYNRGDGFNGFSGALAYLIVFLGLFVSGPGKYAMKMGKLN